MNALEQQDILGRKGVARVVAYAKSKGKVIEDLQGDQYYRSVDVDLIINGQLVEIKTDDKMKCTGNIYVEDISCVEKQSPGWLRKSKAQWVGYIDYRGDDKPAVMYFFA